MEKFHSTTILAVQHNGKTAIGGDGQTTVGNVVMKSDTHKIRKIYEGKVVVGFAGAAADALTLLDRFEVKLKDYQGSIPRAAVEMVKEWRTDRSLQKLSAEMIVVDKKDLLLVGGNGEVVFQPSDGIAATGSGGIYALSAARALVLHSQLEAKDIVRHALEIAGELCIYTNLQIEVEEIN